MDSFSSADLFLLTSLLYSSRYLYCVKTGNVIVHDSTVANNSFVLALAAICFVSECDKIETRLNDLPR